ncbi:hypothetical protein ACS126_11360 [Sphingobacterium lactis]|uniref:hypothetical protein n=1 Tax=Sphingobacterium lactis TaxID=797291 RepID=UPI003EC604B1
MTLKEFKSQYPNTFLDYCNSRYSKMSTFKPLERIYLFLDSNCRIKMNFSPIIKEDSKIKFNHKEYKPYLSIDGHPIFCGDSWLPVQAKKIVMDKALFYLEHGIKE